VRALSPSQTLDVCDLGIGRSPLERALLVIEAGNEESKGDPDGEAASDAASWPLGAVNKALLERRSAIFGQRLELLANCPSCGSICQSEIDCLKLASAAPSPADERILKVGRKRVAFRLLTLGDVMGAARMGGRAGHSLARSLVADASLDLDQRTLTLLSEGVAQADPLASIEIALACPECEAAWSEPLHIIDVLWTELKARCDRLVMEIGRLAQAFGWSEQDILAMSGRRRQRYLELLGS
jgi:hypothetical protein